MTLVNGDEITQVLLYGDQTVEKLPAIRTLVNHAQNSSLVRQFLRDACDIVQIELAKLGPRERSNISDFQSLLGLAEDNARREDPNEIVATILMGTARLGELISYGEENPSVLGSKASPVHVLGLCTGEIVAAISRSRNTTELYRLSIETVRVLCRFAREIIRRSLLVDSTNDSWATTLVGVSPPKLQSILDEFHKSQNVPSLRTLSIGFVGEGWVTLFGPPLTAKRLFNWSTELRDVPRVPTDARGGVHMPHLPELDVDEIVGSSPLMETTLSPNTIMWSPYSREPRSANNLRELLREIIFDVSQKPMFLSDTIHALKENLAYSRQVHIKAVGYTPHLPVLQRAFLSRGINCTTSEGCQPTMSPPLTERSGTNRFAIVGMSGRFPGSDSVEEYWQSLLDAERFIREIPKERFDLEKWYDPTAKQKNATVNRSGAFLDRPGAFDHRLFNMSPREAFQADPLHRLYLTVCHEALEKAGYFPNATPSTGSNRISTWFGQTSDDHRDLLLTKGVDIYYAPGICRSFGPGRINYHFKLGGGSYGVDSACASSVTAISLACSALAARECDMALAGGGSILSSPAPFAGLSRGGFLSAERGCETFHDDADGYVRGEGVGVVIIKRLEDALAENDNILGVIAGAARNYSSDASSISHPSPDAQQRLYRQVLEQSGTDPQSVGYVELHGTGTQAGDFAEVSSVLGTFGEGRTRDSPLVLGAVKANIGHGEAAAGVCALIKALMVLREGKIPPQPGMPFRVNRRFPDLNRLNVHIASADTRFDPSPKCDGKRRLFLNSFDASGGNSCLLLEEPPVAPTKKEDPRAHHVVALSARTPNALAGNQKRYLDYLRSHPNISLADLAYSTTARRMHNSLRTAFVAQSTDDLVKQLDLACEKSDSTSQRKAPSAPVIFAFTGQGSQYCGMGHQLWQHSQEFRRLIKSYQAMTSSLGLPHYVHLIAEGDIDMSSVSTIPIQLAIVAIEIAISQLWMSWGLQPDMVIGHSLGEYAALCIAGVLTVSDTFALVGQRAKMIAEAIPPNQAAMLAISEGADEVRQILSSSFSSCGIACLNGPQSTVVSGATKELERLQEHLRGNNTRSTLLRVPYGFHSPQMDPILDQYESFAAGVDFAATNIPVASTLLGRLVSKSDDRVFGASYLRRQAREPVNFVGALQSAQQADIARPGSMFVEVGPDPVCLGLIRANLAATTKDLRLLPTLRHGEDNWATISNSLAAVYEAGIMINWPEYHRDFVSCLSLLDLPTYAFDEKDFWEPYPDPDADVPAPIEKKESSVASVPGFPTSTLQRIARETVTENQISVVFESSASEKDLLAAIQAHAVVGVKICSSSVLSDMALSAARYACESLQPGASDAIITIRGLDIRHAIVVMDPSLTQIIQVEAKYSKGSSSVYVYFRAKTEDSPFEEIGVCEIQYSQKSQELGWKNDLSRRRLLIDSRIEALHAATGSGQGHRLLRPVVYQLFNGLVEYGARFQGIEEVSLDKAFRDAVGRVCLPPSEGGNFLYNPYLLDAIVHLAGFLANCGLKYPADIAFLSTGFDAWHILKPLSSTASYTSYAYLEESSDGSLLVGDVYVLQDTELVSVLSGLRFQKMKKSALSRILLSAAPAPARKNARFVAEPPIDEGYMSGLSTGPPSSAVTTPPSGASTQGTSVDEDPNLVDTFLRAVAAEAGVDLSELQGDTAFADLGVDSLMTITVIASLSKDTGIELPGSFFLDNTTVAEAIKALAGDSPDSGCEVSDNELSDGNNTSLRPKEQPLLTEQPISAPAPTSNPDCPPAKALLLQGSASPNEITPLFILPDGTGSVSAFVQLPTLARGRRLYGVESPFTRQDPSTIAKTTVESLVSSFVAAIREIQPEGPYLLAGFSHGATYAFEAVHALLDGGHSVQGLLLAGPAPVHASPELKASTVAVNHLEQTGLLASSKRGARPKEHLVAALQALLRYEPKGLGRRPGRITLIRPTKGLLPAAGTEESNTSPISEWVHDNWRRETCGWESLLEDIDVWELDTDYSSMIRYPKITELGQLIDDAMNKFTT